MHLGHYMLHLNKQCFINDIINTFKQRFVDR